MIKNDKVASNPKNWHFLVFFAQIPITANILNAVVANPSFWLGRNGQLLLQRRRSYQEITMIDLASLMS